LKFQDQDDSTDGYIAGGGRGESQLILAGSLRRKQTGICHFKISKQPNNLDQLYLSKKKKKKSIRKMFRRINYSVISRRFSTPAMDRNTVNGIGSVQPLSDGAISSNGKLAALAIVAIGGIFYFNSRRNIKMVSLDDL
jgi:hypothetical protein